MANLKQMAKDYVPAVTKSIVECERIPVDAEVYEKTVTTEKDGKEESFTYKYIVQNELEYRIPVSVIEQLQQLLLANDKVKYFKVSKTGEGLKTKYFVSALE